MNCAAVRYSFAWALCTVFASSLASQAQYAVTDLGTLGGSTAVAHGINSAGQVVGEADTAAGVRHAFKWTSGSMQDLEALAEPSAAYAINDVAQVVGSQGPTPQVVDSGASGSQGPASGFLWTSSGGIQTLLGLRGAPYTIGLAINSAGQIAGTSTNPNTRAIFWPSASSAPQDIGGGGPGSIAYGINGSGQVVGWSNNWGGTIGFLWGSGTGLQMLGALPGRNFSVGLGVNDSGQVVGISWVNGSPNFEAFIWKSSSGMQDLGNLGGGTSRADAVNASGQVVGWATTATGAMHAFLWQSGAMTDLNTLITDSSWVLTEATAINNVGSIVGYGLHNGQMRGFVLTPSKPVVIVVPGIGASTLTDSSQNDQWLSCTSIQLLNQGLNLTPLQYDQFGNPATQLTPRDILTYMDAVGAATLPSNQSIIDCQTSDLVSLACLNGPLSCLVARGSTSRTELQQAIVAASAGGLLQFNAPTPSQDLVGTLMTNGYFPQPWSYDFRKDLGLLANDLYTEVQQVSSAYPGRPVFVLAHSEGSLITAAMLAQHPDVYSSGPLGGVISLGAPFGGALDTYLYIQGWKAFTDFLSAPNTASLANNWTSVYELLPQLPFIQPASMPPPSLNQIFEGTFDPVNFPALPRASIVPNGNNPGSLWGEITNLNMQPFWTAFIGYGQLTDQTIVQAFTPQYLSKPCYQIQEGDGDGTVPLSSAQGSNIPITTVYVNEKHAQLPNNPAVISGILNILGGSSALTIAGLSTTPPPAIILQNTILVNACSPISLSAADSEGNVVSAQSSQIPGGSYTNIGNETQLVLPWTDMFQIQVNGTGPGTFDLVVNAIGGSQNVSSTYSFKAVPVLKTSQGTVLVGGPSIPTLEYNYAGKNVIDQIPANVTPPTIVCTGGYFIIQNARAAFAFNVGYTGGVSTFTYNYRTASQTVQFASIATSEISISGNTASFSGEGTLNGQAGYSFSVIGTDGGGPGSGLDSVAVTITGPNGYSYSANAAVVGGDVIVHP